MLTNYSSHWLVGTNLSRFTFGNLLDLGYTCRRTILPITLHLSDSLPTAYITSKFILYIYAKCKMRKGDFCIELHWLIELFICLSAWFNVYSVKKRFLQSKFYLFLHSLKLVYFWYVLGDNKTFWIINLCSNHLKNKRT